MRKPRGKIKEPTIKKVLNRGWTPIRYTADRSPVRFGWLIRIDRKRGSCVRFPDDDRNRWVKGREQKYIVVLAQGAVA